MSDVSAYSMTYNENRFVLLPRWVTSTVLDECRLFVENLNDAAWDAGDSSNHSWKECGSIPTEIVDLLRLDRISEILSKPIVGHVGWINLFSHNEFIAAHHDASGNSQVILGIDVPPTSSGGQFWLGSPSNIINLCSSDVLLFEAASILHGTTPVDGKEGHRRLTLNVRIWT